MDLFNFNKLHIGLLTLVWGQIGVKIGDFGLLQKKRKPPDLAQMASLSGFLMVAGAGFEVRKPA